MHLYIQMYLQLQFIIWDKESMLWVQCLNVTFFLVCSKPSVAFEKSMTILWLYLLLYSILNVSKPTFEIKTSNTVTATANRHTAPHGKLNALATSGSKLCAGCRSIVAFLHSPCNKDRIHILRPTLTTYRWFTHITYVTSQNNVTVLRKKILCPGELTCATAEPQL
jgi:hypothetical protein